MYVYVQHTYVYGERYGLWEKLIKTQKRIFFSFCIAPGEEKRNWTKIAKEEKLSPLVFPGRFIVIVGIMGIVKQVKWLFMASLLITFADTVGGSKACESVCEMKLYLSSDRHYFCSRLSPGLNIECSHQSK